MPNKDILRLQTPETKALASSPQQHAAGKINTYPKISLSKLAAKDLTMSSGGPAVGSDDGRPELLGSLTTLQQQRTSARVIKKLKLEPPADKRDTPESEALTKPEEKETVPNTTFPTVKQRMPKALWSADEKSVFFEALNEYGKDFDSITAYVCAKMKKKGMPDGNLKTKTQVSHFYYRTWHKLAKHVQFDQNVKKVAQELYALINYGELRRKLVSVNEKTCARLGEMVRCGSMAVRARGRTLRVRTPMCRALRRLNQIAESACGARVCTRAQVLLRARDAAAWARVQAAAHNPRSCVSLPLRTPVATLLRALRVRWGRTSKKQSSGNGLVLKRDDVPSKDDVRPHYDEYDENHLGLPPDRCLLDSHPHKKLTLHVGPRVGAEVHLPVLSPSESLSSQKICFSSYLERMGAIAEDGAVKIRTSKRQRKDSVTDKDKEQDAKKSKIEELEHKQLNIDDAAIDGIELMASYKSSLEDEGKPGTEDEKEGKAEETAEEETEREPERDKDMSEREKDSFSEMEDDEKYNKSDTDNESDSRGDKGGKQRKFKNLKVKFRIRPKKRGGCVYTMVMDKEEEVKGEGQKTEEEVKGEGQKTEEENKVEGQKLEEEGKGVEGKADVDVETALKQIRRGWSAGDAGDLTIGDLYLMFGTRSKLELDYWWAEPTPPLPAPAPKNKPDALDKDRAVDKREKADRTPEKDSSVAEEKRESDTDLLSPKNTFSQDSNDGMSGDEKKIEQLPSSPEHKAPGALRLASKLVNRPAPPPPAPLSQLSDRLKRLLALAGNALAGAPPPPPPRCTCGHVCGARAHVAQPPQHMKQKQAQLVEPAAMFRHPTPIAPRSDLESSRAMSLEDVPRWRRGRPRASEAAPRARACDRRVVVQRLLPLLPKLPPPSNLIPVKIVSNSAPVPPRILPKPAPTSTSDLSFFYVLSESNGQFYFHDGDRRIPIAPLTDTDPADQDEREEEEEGAETEDIREGKMDNPATAVAKPSAPPGGRKAEQQADMTSFLPAESLSLSPSLLLRDAEGWLEGAAHDFSLSSFLQTLDARAPDHAVDSHLQSLMAESSIDYVAKFADLAAEVTADQDPLA